MSITLLIKGGRGARRGGRGERSVEWRGAGQGRAGQQGAGLLLLISPYIGQNAQRTTIYIYIYIYIYGQCMLAYTHDTYIYIYIYIYIFIFIYLFISVCVCVCLSLSVSVCACMTSRVMPPSWPWLSQVSPRPLTPRRASGESARGVSGCGTESSEA